MKRAVQRLAGHLISVVVRRVFVGTVEWRDGVNPRARRLCARMCCVAALGGLSACPGLTAYGDDGYSEAEDRPEWIYFPMPPPPVGVDIGERQPGDPRLGPSVLRNFVDEPFYAPLSARLIRNPLESPDPRPFTAEQIATLEGFLETRDALRAELRRTLDHVDGFDAELRRRELEAFAPVQTPRIVALEAIAERARAELARRDPWDELRTWKLGAGLLKRPREELAALELEVLRAAAYYQEGLSPAQRRLLREHAAEQSELVFARNDIVSAASLFFYFSPDGSRIQRPEDPAGELSALITRYEGDKSLLKRELADTLFTVDRFVFAGTRRRTVEALAHEQASRIAGLDKMAEEIRGGIAALPGFVRRARPAQLPVAIEEQLVAFIRDFAAMTNEREATVARVAEADLETSNAGEADAVERRRAMSSAYSQFLIENFDRMRVFDERAAKIRQTIEEALTPEEIGVSESDPLRFLGVFVDHQLKLQAWYEYEVAVLEPGLSAEQRRLLFGAALQDLRLPVPGPVPQPRKLESLVVPKMR